MIYVYFFLRSLCSLLPTHINFSWSRRFIQKCLKIARGCFFLPLLANPRIIWVMVWVCGNVCKRLPQFWSKRREMHKKGREYVTPLVTQELFIFVQLVAHAPDTHQGPKQLKNTRFLHFLTQPVYGFWRQLRTFLRFFSTFLVHFTPFRSKLREPFTNIATYPHHYSNYSKITYFLLFCITFRQIKRIKAVLVCVFCLFCFCLFVCLLIVVVVVLIYSFPEMCLPVLLSVSLTSTETVPDRMK